MRSLIVIAVLAFSGMISAQDYSVTAPYTSPSRSTCGAGNDCGLTGTEDHQYQVVIPSADTWTISLCASSYDTYLFVGTTLCSNNVGLNDDFCGLQSEVSGFIPAGTYHITVEGFSGCGTYILEITGGALGAPEDDCGGAIPLSCGDIVTGSTAGYNADIAPFCGTFDGTSGGLWYSFLGTGNPVTASLCGSTYDTRIRVYTGSCAGLICEVGNDDFCGLQSEVSWNSTAGVTYYILVHGFGTSQGNYTLSITCPPPPPPLCFNQDPIPYIADPYAGTAVNLTDDVHSGVVNIGFNFCFQGVNYNQCVISSNNYITFELAEANAYSSWVTVAVPTEIPAEVTNSILGPWQDIDPGVGGNIYYQTLGVAPERRFVVSYDDIPMFSCSTQRYTSQIVLYEGSNCIETLILNKPICSTWNSGNAVYAINDAAGASAEVMVGRNNTPWLTSSEGRIWTPDCGICQTPESDLCLSVVLPVEWLGFNGRKDNGLHLLEWSTASESNSDFFAIERSRDGLHFEEIHRMQAAGFSTQVKNYLAVDDDPLSGVNYYRIRQVDYDGASDYSTTIALEPDSYSQSFHVFPNPAKDRVTVQSDLVGRLIVKDMMGRPIRELEWKGDTQLIHIDSWPDGVYTLELETEHGVLMQRLIKD